MLKPVIPVNSVAQLCLTLRPHERQARQTSLSFTISQSLLTLMSIESSNYLILCHPLLILPSILPSNRVFSSELALCIRWPKFWSFSFSISPSNEFSGLISFRIDWFDLAVQGILNFSNTTIQKHQFFTSGGQNIGVSASASVLPMNFQD